MSRKKKKTIKKVRDHSEIYGLLLLSAGIILFLSLLSFAYGYPHQNMLGLLGYIVGWTFQSLFGLGGYILCPFLLWAGWRKLFRKSINHPKRKAVAIALLLFSTCILLSLIEVRYPNARTYLSQTFFTQHWQQKMRYHLGGAPFYYLYHDHPSLSLQHMINATGVALIFTTTLLASILYLAKVSPSSFLRQLSIAYCRLRASIRNWRNKEKKENGFMRFVKLSIPFENKDQFENEELLEIEPELHLKQRPSLSRKNVLPEPEEKPIRKTLSNISLQMEKEAAKIVLPKAAPKREAALNAQRVYNGDFTQYKMPSANLVTPPQKIDTSQLKKNLRKQAEVLEETLCSFGIEAKVGQINCGPTITSFEVHPAIGVKVQKIKSLENDIALNMEAKSIRIIAPIPGKAAIGIEVPNPQPQEVGFRDMLQAYQNSHRKFHVPVLLGKTVNGDYVMNDLAKMPHCIIAGATGSGKSVCINTIVMSILMNARPDEIRMLMVDPKKVELAAYSKLPHMLAPVITEPQGACAALNWLVKEMEERYDILKQTGVRNIEAFNRRKINPDFEASLDRKVPQRMYYIVGIIDELADLMMVSSNDIESPIARIAQMARAVGIHLILATQRPSREVITGLIKANFPTRISFKVASRINSQIVLDEVGAESLLGNGDMLFLPPGTSHLVRAQGAFMRDEDINSVVEYICNQAPPNYAIESFDNVDQLDDSLLSKSDDQAGDLLYSQAKDIILKTGNASTTFLQRKLKIGYARAASLMDMLEDNGVVSSIEGSKPRKVLHNAVDEEPELDF